MEIMKGKPWRTLRWTRVLTFRFGSHCDEPFARILVMVYLLEVLRLMACTPQIVLHGSHLCRYARGNSGDNDVPFHSALKVSPFPDPSLLFIPFQSVADGLHWYKSYLYVTQWNGHDCGISNGPHRNLLVNEWNTWVLGAKRSPDSWIRKAHLEFSNPVSYKSEKLELNPSWVQNPVIIQCHQSRFSCLMMRINIVIIWSHPFFCFDRVHFLHWRLEPFDNRPSCYSKFAISHSSISQQRSGILIMWHHEPFCYCYLSIFPVR